MATQVKICGLRTEAALQAALAYGADYVGFVFFPPSPRHITPESARLLASKVCDRAKTVALTVDPDDALLERVVAVLAPDLLQLHGEETPVRVADVRRRTGKPVMKAVKVRASEDVADAARRFKGSADLLLLDAPPPEGATRPGGNGAAFDWQAIAALDCGMPYMLSGGLTADNVATAIRVTGASIVDVSTGIERRPGEKDPDLIRRFLLAAKGAKQ
jgi:phosphoribosylanthranilate isomerase